MNRFSVSFQTSKCLDIKQENSQEVMSSRKFFSGLPDRMMKGHGIVPNRQQTHFFWPNETDSEQFVPSRNNRLRNRSLSTASLMSQSQASTDTEESKRRRSQNNQSKIEFYDMVDVGTDNESVYSRANDPTKHKKQETLKSRIEFYDYADPNNQQPDDDVQSVIERPVKRNPEPAVVHNIAVVQEKSQKSNESLKMKNEPQSYNENLAQSIQNMSLNSEHKNGYAKSYNQSEISRKKASQYVDSYSESDDEERFYRNRSHVMEDRKNHPPQQPRYPPSQRSIRSHPRRFNSEYFDFDDDAYDRHYESSNNRRSKYRKPENMPRMVRRRDYSPDVSDEEFYEVDGYRRAEYSRAPPPERFRSNASRVDDNESYYRGRSNRRPSSTNGYASEMDFQRNTSTPVRRSSPLNQNHRQEAPLNGNESEMEPRMPVSARPPVKPQLARTNSINEAKARYHVNLKSNIFHNDPEYNVLVEQRKPLSIRDFAARQRVGVGLPDI